MLFARWSPRWNVVFLGCLMSYSNIFQFKPRPCQGIFRTVLRVIGSNLYKVYLVGWC